MTKNSTTTDRNLTQNRLYNSPCIGDLWDPFV